MIYGGIGLSLCTEVAVSGLIGWWIGARLDEKFGVKPWGTLVFILIFIGISFWHVWKVLDGLSQDTYAEEIPPGIPSSKEPPQA